MHQYKMKEMHHIQKNLTLVSSYMKPILLQTEAKAFMPGPRSRYHLLCAGQEAVERCCGCSLLQPVQVLLGHPGESGAALGRQHTPSYSDHSCKRRGRDHVYGQESTGKKESGRLNWRGP